MGVDPVAAGGFSSAASTYARIRPRYARPAVGAVVDAARAAGRGAGVLDVAAGTGILTGQLSRAGLVCTAVEPIAEMVAHLRRALPAVPAVRGVAEALPFPDGSVEVVTVAQAFHWFDADAALAEAARVLVGGGTLALLFNVRDDSTPWVARLDELVEDRTGGRPYTDPRERSWDEVIARSGRFGEVTTRRHPNPVATDVAGVLDRLRSTSFVATLDPAPREELLAEAAAVLDDHGLAGAVQYPHESVVHLCSTPS